MNKMGIYKESTIYKLSENKLIIVKEVIMIAISIVIIIVVAVAS